MNGALRWWGYDLDFLGSREVTWRHSCDVIGHMTIPLAVDDFLWVVHCDHASILHRYGDNYGAWKIMRSRHDLLFFLNFDARSPSSFPTRKTPLLNPNFRLPLHFESQQTIFSILILNDLEYTIHTQPTGCFIKKNLFVFFVIRSNDEQFAWNFYQL